MASGTHKPCLRVYANTYLRVYANTCLRVHANTCLRVHTNHVSGYMRTRIFGYMRTRVFGYMRTSVFGYTQTMSPGTCEHVSSGTCEHVSSGIFEQRRPRSDCASAQSDLGLLCPLTELLPTSKCMKREQTPSCYFTHAQDNLNLRILRVIEGTFSLDATYIKC